MTDKTASAPGAQDTRSRRDFLKSSSAAVVGGALVGNLSLAKSAFAAGDDEIKIALIGCGGRGTGAANQALRTEGKVKLIAMADVFDDRPARKARGPEGSHRCAQGAPVLRVQRL
jgi:anaerobic selenocysteine-containing dehydrogenase